MNYKKFIMVMAATALIGSGLFFGINVDASSRAPKLDKIEHGTETELSKPWCRKIGGEPEYELFDKSRVDCLTDNFAMELDWGKDNKSYDCVGQAIYYARVTNRQGICVIIQDPNKTLDAFYKNTRKVAMSGVPVRCINIKLQDIPCFRSE